MRGDRILKKTIRGSLYTLRYQRDKLVCNFLEALSHGKPFYDLPCSVKLDFYRYHPSYDVDNLVKQSLDLLKDAHILNDDQQVFNIEATIHEGTMEYERDEYFIIEVFEWLSEEDAKENR